MSQEDITVKVNTAVLETISGLLPWYFKIVQVVLFLVALVFALVVVGVMVSGKILLAVIQLVTVMAARANQKKYGVGI